jgi:hypothetical protein
LYILLDFILNSSSYALCTCHTIENATLANFIKAYIHENMFMKIVISLTLNFL